MRKKPADSPAKEGIVTFASPLKAITIRHRTGLVAVSAGVGVDTYGPTATALISGCVLHRRTADQPGSEPKEAPGLWVLPLARIDDSKTNLLIAIIMLPLPIPRITRWGRTGSKMLAHSLDAASTGARSGPVV
ncbi:predicted protein [Histoplasma capsulatum H143]|uniref:Uncharacterized protein n=1 Tax=Ajellomyces capsulatus (strain H143) TaxID=544712 RepID=C6HJN2_AJECH|nr:predicted protein [Histoplasma capsulatum H143]